jgi:hypothetical protein
LRPCRDFGLSPRPQHQGHRAHARPHGVKTFGQDFATADAEYTRPGLDGTSRQSQTWVRMPEGWRIVSAHVSDFAAAS